MKSLIKTSAAVAVLAFAQQASADLTVNMTGSTAFRGVVNTAVANLYGGAANCKIAHNATVSDGLGKATKAIWQGNTGTFGILTVRVAWSGSVTGIRDVDQQNDLAFLTTATLPASNGQVAALQTTTENGKAQFAFSDVFQASTEYNLTTLDDQKVGVLPFVWIASEGTATSGTGNSGTWSNITAQQVRGLWASGNRKLSYFTGVPTDTMDVYATGRDPGSGTRLTALAETKYGAFTPVQQWKGSPVDAAGTLASVQLWPAEVVDGVLQPDGNSGWSSGGDLAKTIGALAGVNGGNVQLIDETGANFGTPGKLLLVGYVGYSDFTGSATGAKLLKYEGVDYSASAIQYGQYTFWCYEHFMAKPSLTTNEGTFQTQMKTQINSAISTPNLKLSDLVISVDGSNRTVNRTSDGGLVSY